MSNDIDGIISQANVAGTRQNKMVLEQHSRIADSYTGGSYTVKKYAPDGTW